MSASVQEFRSGPGCLVRAVYFVLIGWWLTGIWSAVAWGLMATIIGLPIGLWMVNRLPQVLALMPARMVAVTTTDAAGQRTTVVGQAAERPFVVRAVYFVLIGWWFSAIWMGAAYVCAVSIVGLSFALWLYNRVPLAMTLKQV
jgi:uncharacterized membrane protein YccF (DUF307 family)